MIHKLILLLAISLSPAHAEESSETIVVEDTRDKAVYVLPPIVINKSSNIIPLVNERAPFTYAAMYWHQAKHTNGYGGFDSIKKFQKLLIYNEDTIVRAREICDNDESGETCSVNDFPYTLETRVVITDLEMTVTMTLYNPDFTVLNVSTVSKNTKFMLIKQQEITVTQNSGLLQNTTVINKPKEEAPMVFYIPSAVFDNQVQQASTILWSGVRIE